MTLLEVENLHKSFGGIQAAQSISFAVREGEVFGVIGPNGAGKTTLFNLITGFIRPDEGRVTFDGHRITGLRPDQISRLGLSRTFQIAEPMIGLTVEESVLVNAYSRPGASRKTAFRAAASSLEQVGLGDKAGLLTGSLTAAESHRLEFAKALASQPKLILLDEIAAGLWPEEQEEIANLIGRCSKKDGIAFLIVEHKLAFMLSVAETSIVINFGEKIAEGHPRDVLQDPAVIQAYLGSQEGSC